MRILLAACALVVSANALATLPISYKWYNTDGTGNPNFCAKNAENQCKTYGSAQEACTDLAAYGSPPPWNLKASGLEQGTPPNDGFQTCLGNFLLSGCLGANSACNTGRSAKQVPSLPFCPINGASNGSACVCADGSIQANGKCSGGKNNGPACPLCANPVNPSSGNKLHQQLVYRGLNGFELLLTYNTFDEERGPFGKHWRSSFDRRIALEASVAMAYRQDGRVLRFTSSGGQWVADAEMTDRLVQITSPAGWELRAANGDEVETYDSAGKLLTIRSRSGLVQTMAYSEVAFGPNGSFVLDQNGNSTGALLAAGHLIRVTDNFGRTLVFEYDGATRIVRVTDPASGIYRIGYAFQDLLSTITYPDTRVITFVYNEPANTGGADLQDAVTGIVDENGNRFATYQYNAQYRTVSSEHAGGAGRHQFSYSANDTTVTDPLNSARSYGFQLTQDAFKNTGITGGACPSCGAASQTFDANGNVATRVDWNGNRTNYTHDLVRNLETSRTEGLTAEGGTTPQTRTITTAWHSIFRLPTQIAEPLRSTTNVYDADGSACGARGALCSRTIQATNDANGSQGLSATPLGTPRMWSYTYNANGSVLTVNGPRTDVADVTTYTYYANDDADLGKRGNVATINNALGHITSISAYNAHGQPLTIVDPNGLTTTLTYDERQRLKTRTVGSEVTSYDYDGVGQLTKVTLPDGSFLSYSYDAAHRLTGLQDNQGNRIAYALDAMGNRTQEQVFDPANQLAQTRTRVFNSLNRLFRELGAQSQTTEYTYDNQGNVLKVKDPLNRETSNQYDALNRLRQVTDPADGVTHYAYNGLDALTQVTDPRNLVTGYTVDGLGNLTSQSSPDTGNTANTYDAAGNLLTQTDAKGQTTSYAYDALNRVTLITFHDGSKQAYAYDQGANAKGRLSSITETDPANQLTAVIDYAYDLHGRVTVESTSVAAAQYLVGYAYDTAGRLASITYPSGRTATYGYDALGRVSSVSTAKDGETLPVVSNVAYHPFGGVKSFTFGNGQSYTRSYDADGRIASYTLGATAYAIGYDAANRIQSIQPAGGSANTYTYDDLDRLTGASLPGNVYAYSYDPVGNRLTRTIGSATESLTYSPTSNRIESLTPASGPARSFVFDANGSTSADGVNTYAYDTRGRMKQAVSAAGTTSYQVNALGQRIRKTNSQGDTVFHYDRQGRLIAETDPGGSVKRELIYLGDMPVGAVQ